MDEAEAAEGDGFAAVAGTTDGREILDSRSRWSRGDWVQIVIEALYVLLVVAATAVVTFLVWRKSFMHDLNLSASSYRTFETYALGILGGILAGPSST